MDLNVLKNIINKEIVKKSNNTIKIKKRKKAKKKQETFFCHLPKRNNKSTVSYLANKYGIDGMIFNFHIKINEKVEYNGHLIHLYYSNDKLMLKLDNEILFWEISLLEEKSKTYKPKDDIIVSFQKREDKDHGTKITILN